MALVQSVDYAARRIYLSSSTMNATLDTLDVNQEVRTLRMTTEAHRRFRPMIVAGGNIAKIPGVSYTPPYVQLLYGCRIVPYNSTHTLKLVRDTFTDDGFAARDCFNRSSLTPGVVVDIDVDVPAVEVREVNIAGGGGSDAPTAAENAEAVLSDSRFKRVLSGLAFLAGAR
jgi:hypothetical protein